MNETKKAHQSVAVWGGAIAALAPIIALTTGVDISTAEINELVSLAAGLVGGVMAIVGRVKASKTISGV